MHARKRTKSMPCPPPRACHWNQQEFNMRMSLEPTGMQHAACSIRHAACSMRCHPPLGLCLLHAPLGVLVGRKVDGVAVQVAQHVDELAVRHAATRVRVVLQCSAVQGSSAQLSGHRARRAASPAHPLCRPCRLPVGMPSPSQPARMYYGLVHRRRVAMPCSVGAATARRTAAAIT